MKSIILKSGNIFTTQCQTIVNTVNCYGEMGAGIALEFKYCYPEMYSKYVELCKIHEIEVGKLWIYRSPNRWVLNFPTKNHWKYPSKIEYLEAGLSKFLETYKKQGIKSIAFPLLGAQNGGLDADVVKQLMSHYLNQCDIPIEIYDYDYNAKDDLYDNFSSFIQNSTANEIEKQLNLKSKTVTLIRNVIESNSINSLFKFKNIQGIGEKTIQAIYSFAMRNNTKVSFSQESVFANSSAIDKELNKIIQELTIDEKVKMTGLDLKIIELIENSIEESKLKDIKKYCKTLNIPFKELLPEFYSVQQ